MPPPAFAAEPDADGCQMRLCTWGGFDNYVCNPCGFSSLRVEVAKEYAATQCKRK